jgi:hypothetical protein
MKKIESWHSQEKSFVSSNVMIIITSSPVEIYFLANE